MKLSDAKPSLASLDALLAALTQNQASVCLIEGAADSKTLERPVLSQNQLVIPEDYLMQGVLQSQRSTIQFAMLSHAAAHLLFSKAARAINGLKPMGIAVVSAIEDARVERLMIQHWPGTASWFKTALACQTEELGQNFSALIHRLSRALIDTSYADEHYWVLKARRLFEQQCNEEGLADYDGFRKIASILANDLGQMRVQFNAQQYLVPERYRDDNAYLWDFKKAELNAQIVPNFINNAQTETSKNESKDDKSEQFNNSAADLIFSYPEWDYKSEILKKNWVELKETRHLSWPGYLNHRYQHQTQGEGLQQALVCFRANAKMSVSKTRLLRAQYEGDNLDLNAALDFQLSRRLGLSDEPKCFLRAAIVKKPATILLLLDLSESTNDTIAKQKNTSILDLEKAAALSFAQAAIQNGDRIAIHGFCSNGRKGARYKRLLEFDQVLTDNVRAGILSLKGEYSTRIGVAIRHASNILQTQQCDLRTLMLVTDGTPSDIDVYHPDYLLEDGKRAVHEARLAKIVCYGLILDKQADRYGKKIFGTNQYRVIDRVERLAHHLESCYQQLAKSY